MRGDSEKRSRNLALAVFLAFATLSQASAEERIGSFATRIDIADNGAAAVTHEISVRAEGDEIRRGIFFEIPDGVGRIEDIRVARNGAPEPFALDGDELRIGDEGVFLEDGAHDYAVSYRAASPFLELKDGTAAFDWRPIVRQFDLPVGSYRLSIAWPQSAAPIETEGGEARAGSLSWSSNRGEDAPRKVGAVFPGDAFPAASVRPRPYNPELRWLAVLAVAFAWLYFHTQWRSHGKDLRPGPVSPHHQPPRAISPGAARYVARMRHDAAAFAAALTSLAAKGALAVEREKKKKLIARLRTGAAQPSEDERAALDALFAKGDPAILTPGSGLVSKAVSAHGKALKAAYGERYFATNKRRVMVGFAVAAVAALAFAAAMILELRKIDEDVIAVFLALLAMSAMLLIPGVYAAMMRAPTVEGRALMDEIDGLKRYLKGEAPLREASAEEFVRLLPFAVALDAEEEWRARFDHAALANGGEEAVRFVDWYGAFQASAEQATMAAAILPVVASSSSSVTTYSGGASAGGW